MPWKKTAIAALMMSACLPAGGALAQLSVNDFLHMGRQLLERDVQRSYEPRREGRNEPRQPQTVYDTLTQAERRDLQTALAQLGHYGGKIDGQFGGGSRDAAARYQRQSGYESTGYLTRPQIEGLLATAQSTEVAASSATAKTGTKAVPTKGMPVRDGIIQLVNPTNDRLRQLVGGGDEQTYDGRLDRFGRLLILAGNPGLLDDPATTEFFMPLVDLERLKPYLNDMTYRMARDYGRGHLSGWKGANQFAQEDSRKAFLAAFRDELRAQIAVFPLRVDIVTPVNFGRYDGTSLELRDHSWQVWPHYNSVGLEVPETSPLPESWALSEAEARRMVEAVSENPYDSPVVVTRIEILEARSKGSGVILNIAVKDRKIYARGDFKGPFGALPLTSGN